MFRLTTDCYGVLRPEPIQFRNKDLLFDPFDFACLSDPITLELGEDFRR